MWPETWICSPILRLTCKWFLTSSKYMNIWSSRTNFRLKLTTTKDFNTEEGPLKMRWEGLTWFFGCHTGSWDPHTHTGRDRKWSSSLLLGNLDQSHFILQRHYWFNSQSQHCAAGMKSCTARPSSINKLSGPEGCACVRLVPSPVTRVMNMEQLLALFSHSHAASNQR